MPEMRVDPSEIIKGLCVCFDLTIRDVKTIHIEPGFIEIEYLARTLDGEPLGFAEARFPWWPR
jgi:hypothetical protein